MRKCIVLFTLLIVFSIMMFPTYVFAKNLDLSDYNSMDLQSIFKEEGITYDFSNYKETDDMITIYLFRGKGCAYCKKFLNYVADTLLDKYGDKFKIVGYEVWYDSSNSGLMTEVADFMGDNVSGVPYIVIGDKTFLGYASTFDSDIEEAINTLYNSNDRYDVFEELLKESDSLTSTTSSNTATVVIWNIVITSIAVFVLICNNNKTKRELEKEIKDLKSMIKKDFKMSKN